MSREVIGKMRSHTRMHTILLKLRHPIRSSFGFIYSGYLTLRYVDEWTRFPSIVFQGPFLRPRIKKLKGGKLILRGKLIFTPWFDGKIRPIIRIGQDASLEINGEFSIGDDVRIDLFPGAKLILGGRNTESASGITCKSIILVHSLVEIGKDTIIAWDTFITDCDWHGIEGKTVSENTKIGNHVWIAVGAKILKGVTIGDNSIVGCGSVVVTGEYPPNSMIVGIPGIVSRSDIPNWHRELES